MTRRAPVPIEDVPEEVTVPQLSLRRTLSTFAASAMVVGGSVAFVVAAAGADTAVPAAVPAGAIALNNATASPQSDCPDDGFAYWHFILAPNGKGLALTEISLRLSTDGGSEVATFSGAALVPNGVQLDNVFVAVPASHTLDDIVLGDDSYAFYSGSGAVNFTLSHTCEGTVPTTTPTSSSTSTSSTSSTSSTATTAPSTTTTEATTTTTEATTTTTEATTTTTEATTTTTEATTTTTEAEAAATTSSSSTTVADEVLGTVQTTSSVVAVEAAGDLPYTGSNTAAMVVAGLTVVAGGAVLAGLARSARRTTKGS